MPDTVQKQLLKRTGYLTLTPTPTDLPPPTLPPPTSPPEPPPPPPTSPQPPTPHPPPKKNKQTGTSEQAK